jgi:hypothetical protein
MAVVCSEVKEDYFLATIGAIFDDNDEADNDEKADTEDVFESGSGLHRTQQFNIFLKVMRVSGS